MISPPKTQFQPFTLHAKVAARADQNRDPFWRKEQLVSAKILSCLPS